MRSQGTGLGKIAEGLDDSNRTLPIPLISPQSAGHPRQRTAGSTSVDSRPRGDGVDGSIEWNPCATGSSGCDDGGAVAADAGDRIVAGRYRLSTLLGTGGMGAVWLSEGAVLTRGGAAGKGTRREGGR